MAGAALTHACPHLTTAPLLVCAPGRVNLIGEHTDYNDGLVMPIAIDRCTSVRIGARSDHLLRVTSQGFAQQLAWVLPLGPDREPAAADAWGRYVQAVVRALQDAGYSLAGADVHISSDVPMGSGLSSSAALEVACAYALLRRIGVQPDLTALARLCQRAENEYVGARCGIMDQFVACHGRAGHALLLDCRDLSFRHVALRFAVATRVMVCNSMVRHALASSEYNERRAQCEAGVRQLAVRRPLTRSLRDVSSVEFADLAPGLDPLLQRRCRHVITENERVSAAAAAIERGDAAGFGQLMYASHASLRDDYAVSCAELDQLVEIARGIDGVYGARMTGGGFGGSTVNLVRADQVAAFTRTVTQRYAQRTGRTPEIFACQASDGVREADASGTRHE